MFSHNAQGSMSYDLNTHNQLLQPDVPLLYDWFKTYCQLDDNGVYGHNNQYISNGVFVPRPDAPAGHNTHIRLGRHAISVQAAAAVDVETVRALGSLGIDSVTTDSADRMNECFAFWRESNFRHTGPDTSNNTNIAGANFTATQFADMLRMPNSNWEWFSDCIKEAVTHATFFHGSTNLQSLDVWGSSELGILSTVHFNRGNRAAVTAANNTIPWFPRLHREADAYITWYEDNVKDHHRWNARHTLTNSQVQIDWSHRLGGAGNATPIDDRGLYSEDPAGTATNPAPRFGPFWDRTRIGVLMPHRILGLQGHSAPEINVLDGREEMILHHFYSFEGKGDINF